MIPPQRPNVTKLTDESVLVSWNIEEQTGVPVRFYKVNSLNEV